MISCFSGSALYLILLLINTNTIPIIQDARSADWLLVSGLEIIIAISDLVVWVKISFGTAHTPLCAIGLNFAHFSEAFEVWARRKIAIDFWIAGSGSRFDAGRRIIAVATLDGMLRQRRCSYTGNGDYLLIKEMRSHFTRAFQQVCYFTHTGCSSIHFVVQYTNTVSSISTNPQF